MGIFLLQVQSHGECLQGLIGKQKQATRVELLLGHCCGPGAYAIKIFTLVSGTVGQISYAVMLQCLAN
jgi:hypothetical protein